VLANRCYECHGPELQESKLRVDSREALLTGGKSGPALRPGQPDESLMIRAIRHQAKPKMPPIGGKLPAKEIDDLAAWVKMGAPGLGRSSTPAATLSSAPLKGI
jgi:mono/diheme cytochrome c family protein